MFRLSARAVSARSAAVASLGQRVAILSRASRARPRRCVSAASARADRLLGDLEAAGVLVAARLEGADRVLQAGLGPRRALVAAADAGLQPVPQRALVAVEVVELLVADRGGGAEEGLVGDAGQVGDDLVGPAGSVYVWPSSSSETRPRWPRNSFSRTPVADGQLARASPSSSTTNSSRVLERPSSARPRCAGLELGAGGRRLAEERQLEAALDRRLAGLVGAANDREAGRELQVEVAVPAEVLAAGGE